MMLSGGLRIRTEEGTREWRVRTSLRHWTFLLTGCQPRQYLNVVWYCEIGGEYEPRRAGACPALRLDARELQGSKRHQRARTEVGEGVLEFVDEFDEVGVHGWEDGWRVVGVVKGVVDEEDEVESLQSSNIGLSELGAKSASPRPAPDPWALPHLSCFSSMAVLPAHTLPLGCPPLSVRLLSGHVLADQPHRAMPSQYEPLGQEAPDDYFHAESSSRVNTAFPPKPETYYGEGPFDPPSSDDDESEVLLEKNGSRRGIGIFEEEGHLIVGSTKVRALSCMCPVPANRPLFQETACLVEIPDPWPRNSRIYCCRHGRIRRRIIHRDTVPRTGRPAPHHGPLFQRHILYK